jgi:NitT/TauT family transport system substrate-binding protein
VTTVATIAAAITVTACSAQGYDPGSEPLRPVSLRLGYFPNLTHASAVVGVEKGIFAKRLGITVDLTTRTFNAGPAAIQALLAGEIDATYVGPNPTLEAYAKSNGDGIRVVAGACSGGAGLVVKPGITSVAALRGKRIATPQLGNTQDVALRYFLKRNGLRTNPDGTGDVTVVPQDNTTTVKEFGKVDGAWVPEPFLTRLLDEGGRLLVDERALWTDRRFVVTNLIVSTKFLKAHPDVVRKLVEGQVAANDYLAEQTEDAQQAISYHVGNYTGKPLDVALIKKAWPRLEFTNDPIAPSMKAGLDHAVAVGLAKPIDTRRLYDLSFLNEVLKEQGRTAVPLA